MKSIIAAFAAAAGACTMAGAVVNTTIQFQLSLDGVNWQQHLPVSPGTTVAVRALVTYTGTGSPFGLASFIFQPTMSNASSGDVVMPFIQSGISGSQLFDMTSFGRVIPWVRVNPGPIRSFFHTNPNGDGVNYLRIAQATATSWIGGPGNTSGGLGVNLGQLANVGRTTSDPPFNNSLSSIYVFKWGVTFDPNATNRPVSVFDAPLAGFGQRNSSTGDREVYWWGDMNESSGSIRGTALVIPADTAPAPASLTLLGLGAMAIGRRRGAGVGRMLS